MVQQAIFMNASWVKARRSKRTRSRLKCRRLATTVRFSLDATVRSTTCYSLQGVLCALQYGNGMNEHQLGEDNEIQTSQSFREAFIVAREPSKPIEPTKAAFNHPPSRQKNEPLSASGSLMTCNSIPSPRAGFAGSSLV